MSDTAYVTELPECNMCGRTAQYDARLYDGTWANLCQTDWKRYTSQRLGTGFGQRYIMGERPKPTRSQVMEAIESGDFDAAEDLIGDGDISEWL